MKSLISSLTRRYRLIDLCFAPGVHGELWGVIKSAVNHLRFCREDRTGFVRMTTNRDNIVEYFVAELIDRLAWWPEMSMPISHMT